MKTKITKNDNVQITMSKDEASTLRQILSHIGGSPDGPRGQMDKIDNALHEVSIDPSDHKLDSRLRSIYIDRREPLDQVNQ